MKTQIFKKHLKSIGSTLSVTKQDGVSLLNSIKLKLIKWGKNQSWTDFSQRTKINSK